MKDRIYQICYTSLYKSGPAIYFASLPNNLSGEGETLFAVESEEVVYSLKYDMIVHVLKQFKYTGEARAIVSVRSPLKQEGHIILTAQNGSIINSTILNKSYQKLYHGQEAERLLPGFGVLEWQLAPFAASQTPGAFSPAIQRPQPTSSTYNSPFFPRKLPVAPLTINEWSPLQRSVYSLSDGIHTIEQISTILVRPIGQIEQIINDLYRTKAIE